MEYTELKNYFRSRDDQGEAQSGTSEEVPGEVEAKFEEFIIEDDENDDQDFQDDYESEESDEFETEHDEDQHEEVEGENNGNENDEEEEYEEYNQYNEGDDEAGDDYPDFPDPNACKPTVSKSKYFEKKESAQVDYEAGFKVLDRMGSADVNNLLKRIQAQCPRIESRKIYWRVKQIEWDRVAFSPFTGEDCKNAWLYLNGTARKYRSLYEVVDEVMCTYNFHKRLFRLKLLQLLPDFPKSTCSRRPAYCRWFLQTIWAQTPEDDKHDFLKRMAKSKSTFEALPEEEKAKWKAAYHAKAPHEYRREVKEFYSKFKTIPLVGLDDPTRRPKELLRKPMMAIDNGRNGGILCKPKYPPRPKAAYVESQIRKIEPRPHWRQRPALREKFSKKWNDLKEKTKAKWINLYVEKLKLVAKDSALYKKKHPKFVIPLIQIPCLLSKDEIRIYEMANKKPEPPPKTPREMFLNVFAQQPQNSHLTEDEMKIEGNKKYLELSPADQRFYKTYLLSLLEDYHRKLENYWTQLPKFMQVATISSIPFKYRKRLKFTVDKVSGELSVIHPTERSELGKTSEDYYANEALDKGSDHQIKFKISGKTTREPIDAGLSSSEDELDIPQDKDFQPLPKRILKNSQTKKKSDQDKGGEPVPKTKRIQDGVKRKRGRPKKEKDTSISAKEDDTCKPPSKKRKEISVDAFNIKKEETHLAVEIESGESTKEKDQTSQEQEQEVVEVAEDDSSSIAIIYDDGGDIESNCEDEKLEEEGEIPEKSQKRKGKRKRRCSGSDYDEEIVISEISSKPRQTKLDETLFRAKEMTRRMRDDIIRGIFDSVPSLGFGFSPLYYYSRYVFTERYWLRKLFHIGLLKTVELLLKSFNTLSSHQRKMFVEQSFEFHKQSHVSEIAKAENGCVNGAPFYYRSPLELASRYFPSEPKPPRQTVKGTYELDMVEKKIASYTKWEELSSETQAIYLKKFYQHTRKYIGEYEDFVQGLNPTDLLKYVGELYKAWEKNNMGERIINSDKKFMFEIPLINAEEQINANEPEPSNLNNITPTTSTNRPLDNENYISWLLKSVSSTPPPPHPLISPLIEAQELRKKRYDKLYRRKNKGILSSDDSDEPHTDDERIDYRGGELPIQSSNRIATPSEAQQKLLKEYYGRLSKPKQTLPVPS